jgi:hypothetical protein
MDFYVRYFEAEIRQHHHNPTIGLILCTKKSPKMAQYTLLKDSEQIFASEYRLYLPSEKELSQYLAAQTELLELEQRLEQAPDSPETIAPEEATEPRQKQPDKSKKRQQKSR